MYNPYTLKDKLIFITGASSGIGQSTAVECSKLGAKLIITGRDPNRLNETFEKLIGDGHMQLTGDLTQLEDRNRIVSALPRLDGIVFCSGILKTLPTKFIQQDDISEIFTTNYNSVVNLCAELLRAKKILKQSSIVFISSLAAKSLSQVGNAIYSSSKAAILAYARVLALELGQRKIRVNTVLPAMVKTSLLKSFSVEQDQFDTDENSYPLGYGEPADVAYLIIYLLSDASKWVTGSEFVLDGGVSLR